MLPTGLETATNINKAIGQDIKNMPVDEGGRNTQAGYTSLMAEGTATGDTYFQVINENEEQGASPTTYEVNEMLHTEESERMSMQLPEILLDENLGDDFKRLATQYATSPERKENDLSYQYGRDQLETPESAENNLEYMDSKQALFKSLDNINQYRQAQQSILDQSNLTRDQNAVATSIDFISMIVPFYEQINQAEVVQKAMGGDTASMIEAFVLIGNSKAELRNYLEKLPLEERITVMTDLAGVLDEANTTLGMTNRLTGKAQLEELVYGGQYADWERWVDNVVGILDATIVGKPVAWLARSGKTAEAFEAGVKASKVKNTTRPTSPHRMAQETNAETARKQVAEILEDTTEEASQALTGASRTDAVADSVMPEVQVSGQGLRNKAGNILAEADKVRISNPQIREVVDETAIGALTKKEIQAATAKVVYKLQNAKGVTSRNEMFQVKQGELGATIKGVYGPTEGGYKSAQEGVDLVTLSMRSQGVTPDELKVLKRNAEGEYEEVKGIPTEDGDYLVSFDFDYTTRFSDVTGNWEKFGVARNFLDRVPLFAKKTVNRHIFDPASSLDPHIVLGANAVFDKSARLTKLMLEDAKKFSDKLSSITGERQQLVDQYIKEANEKGLKFDAPSLKADWGFNDTEIDALKSFRSYWDDVWAMRNRTEAKAMRNDGFLVLEDAVTATRLFGKPRAKGNIDRTRAILDPNTDDFRVWTDTELDELYANGGGIIQTRRPVEFDGLISDYVVYRKGESVRTVRDSDVVYPYRDGYFQVMYDSPHFITKTVKDGDREYVRAVATAESTKDADMFIKRLQLADPAGEYSVRGNVKDPSERAGFERDVFETYGDSSQRIRRQRLTDATAVVQNTEQSNIKGPVDTMIDVARGLGSRVAISDYINATKQRFMENYKDLLPTKNGLTLFPARVEDIGSNAKALDKDVANARTTFEYIAYLEHGYVASMDEAWKGVLRAAAEVTGSYSTKGESVLRGLSNLAPTEVAKTAAFQAYIAMNPLRQGLLNAHQSMLLLANFPKYMVNPKGVTADMAAFTDLALGGKNLKNLSKMGGRSEAELKIMWEEFQKSGLADSIDFNNMVRGSLQQFAENSRISGGKVAQGVSKAFDFPRKVGFDAGEWMSLATSWLAHYDRAAQSGKALNRTDFHRIGAEARNYTLNMNAAGDMPYNHNAFALLFQFFQVPHKALLQMSTNRVLKPAERVRLFGYNALAYSLPPAAMYSMFGAILPDRSQHPEMHDAFVQGLEFYLFNRALRTISPDTNIDFSSLSPADAYGVYELIHALLTTEVGQVVAKSPAGSLFFGDNPRFTNFAKSVGKFVNPLDEDPVSAGQLFREFASITSGYSNYFRAKMAFENHKMYNAQGIPSDANTTTPEAVARLFGFGTMDEALARHLNEKAYKTREQAKKDVNLWWKEHSARLFRQGVTSDELDYELTLMSQAMRVFKDSPWAMEEFNSIMEKQISKGDGRFFDVMLRATDMMTPAEAEEFFNNVPDLGEPEKAKALKETIENIRKWDYE